MQDATLHARSIYTGATLHQGKPKNDGNGNILVSGWTENIREHSKIRPKNILEGLKSEQTEE